MSLASVAVSWLTLHTVFTLRYARLYYSPPAAAVAFPPGRRGGPQSRGNWKRWPSS